MKQATAGMLAFVILALSTLGAGCSRVTTTEPTQVNVAALTGPQQFTIRLPDAAGLPGVAISASDTLHVSDRVWLVSPSTGFVSMTNTGSVQTDVGTDTRLGNIFSQSPVVIRDRSQVAGDVQSTSTVTLVNGASVAGTITEHVPLVAAQTFSWVVNFPTPGVNVNLEPGQSRVLAPEVMAI